MMLQVTCLLSALLGEVVAVRVSVEPTCTVELPEIETDVTRTGSYMVIVFVLVTPEPSDAVAVTVMLPALSSSMVHLPPVDVSDWLVIVALEDPDVISNVTPRLSADKGVAVAVMVILPPTAPEDDPEIEMDETGMAPASILNFKVTLLPLLVAVTV